MTTETQEDSVAQGEELLRSLHYAISSLRREIEALARQAESNSELNETATSQSLNKVRDLVVQCAKAENYIHEDKNKRAGIVQGGYALDLDRARAEIGCKLDRLRRCGRPRPVPE